MIIDYDTTKMNTKRQYSRSKSTSKIPNSEYWDQTALVSQE